MAAVFLIGLAGCERKETPRSHLPQATNALAAPIDAPVAAPASESWEQVETRMDRTVWKDEILSQSYEQVFVRLADAFRQATNKLAVLGSFDFDEIVLPKPAGAPSRLPLDIQRQVFVDGGATVPHEVWRETLERFAGSGWRLEQAEWSHDKFRPPQDGHNAWSEFAFEIHGERLAAGTHFIMRGTLGVDWDKPPEPEASPRAHRLKVTALQVLERAGPTGFKSLAVVTPNPPERAGDMVNMHPVLVTDLNGDHHEDIVLAGVNQLFVNDGRAGFKPIPFISESVFRGSTDAGVIADLDGDGWLDFGTVAKQGSLTNKFVIYRDHGTVPFDREPIQASDVTIVAPSVMSVADIDHDGDLDVWIAQYKPPYKGGQLPTPYYDSNDGYPSFLLLNDGHGRFVAATSERGLGRKAFRRTLAASFVDLNNDGHPDLLTVNDYAGVDLYSNDGHGHFTDESARLYNPHLFGMGHCFADFDGDGSLDFLAIGMNVPTVRRLEFMKIGREDRPIHTRKRTDMAYGNRVYVNRTNRWEQPPFADQLAATGWSWGTSAFDFDNNGQIDVYVANGHISGESAADYDSRIWTHDIYVGTSREDRRLLQYFDKPFRGINTGKSSSNGFQHNVLFMDVGTNEYVNVAYLMGVALEADCRAVVSADLNNDGRQDLVLTEGQWFGGPHTGRNRLHIYLNQLPITNHWIGVRLSPRLRGCSPIGAKIRLRTPSRVVPAQVVTGDSFQCQHPFRAHFGLGRLEHVEELIVEWPNGRTQKIASPRIDTYHDFDGN